MARGVNYLDNAYNVWYLANDFTEDYQWEDFMDNLSYELIEKYPSLETCDRWDNRETLIFLENSKVEIGVSEYFGVISISIRAKDYDGYNDYQGLSENWINLTESGMTKVINGYGEAYRKVGSFSNGESVYELL